MSLFDGRDWFCCKVKLIAASSPATSVTKIVGGNEWNEFAINDHAAMVQFFAATFGRERSHIINVVEFCGSGASAEIFFARS